MMNLKDLARLTSGELFGFNANFNQVSIDSRTLKPGDLFFAIRGERFNGHDFCQAAIDRGASALVVDNYLTGLDFPQLVVSDTLQALRELAKYHRQQFDLPICAVTGSCGKTTVKQMLSAILSECGPTFATEGNLNNHIGLPLSVLKLNEGHLYGVFELGANHVGEIADNGTLVKPNIAAITCIASAHIEGFGSLENISKAKSEIFQSLCQGGVAIAEWDSPYLENWKALRSDLNWITFGLNEEADVFANQWCFNDKAQMNFNLHIGDELVEIQLPLMGEHNVKNATAAAAMAYAAGAPLAAIQSGLAKTMIIGGRLRIQSLSNGALLIDDTYNANPESVCAAIDTLKRIPRQSILVLGDMAELGPDAERYHAEVAKYAKKAGVESLYVIGEFSEVAAKAFDATRAKALSSKERLVSELKSVINRDVVCLVKGSRSAKMEEVVLALVESE